MQNFLGLRRGCAAGLASIALVFAGCGDDEDESMVVDSGSASADSGSATDSGSAPGDSGSAMDSGSADEDAAATPMAMVRVLHLSPDAPAVSVYANDGDTAVVPSLEFPNGTDYLSVPAATYDFDVAPAGMGAAATVLAVDGVALDGDAAYTVVAYGLLEAGSETPLAALALLDDPSDVDAGMIRVRAVHTAAGVGQVDIWNVPSSGAPTPVFEDLDYGSASDYAMLPSGAYTLGLDVDDDMTPDFTFTTPELAEGTIASLYAVAPTTGTPYLLAQFADSTTARIDAD